MRHVCFVCTGNICRSPFGEYRMRSLVSNDGRTELLFSSAGTHALVGYGCPPEATQVADKFDISLRPHLAQQLSASMLRHMDLAVVMSPQHEYDIREICSGSEVPPIVPLAAFAPPGPYMPDHIPDPFGERASAYLQCYQFMDACLKRLWDAMKRQSI